MSRGTRLAPPPRAGGPPGPARGAGRLDALPEVLLLDDVATVLRCSPTTIKRRLRAHTFPVAPLAGIDRRLRWSKTAVAEWLAVAGPGALGLRRRRRA